MSMQFGLDAMAGGHPGVHGLGDGAKLGQHFADRYTGLQWKPVHVYCLFTVQLYWLFMVQVIRKKNLNQKYSGFSYLSSSVSHNKLFFEAICDLSQKCQHKMTQDKQWW